ncbi:iron ABC transporter permease [Helicobacter sp. MIT 05-5293]|uniref:FecCD family ABC transporter permease n=1 Tax=Helicobacter sp. MIT 05-5293 TaxID=1548149 RepID=UPI00051DEF89|nr:iron ABC transporter permease [Helicobacter sp. MIT 05-5293]TLD81499.1 iron ABC transporter permease [Helicobacter sp. MIT 05-5293]
MIALSARKILWIVLLACALVGFALYAIGVGTLSISYHKIFAMIFGSAQDVAGLEDFVVFEVRIPRIIASIVVGGSLALSGALYQGIIGNPLVSPSILGVLNGASFGAALGMLLGFNVLGMEALCFAFGIFAMSIAVLLSQLFDGRRSILMLILGGMISSAFFGAGVSVLKLLADPYNTLPNIVFWLMGSLSGISGFSFPLVFASVIFVLSFIFSTLFARYVDILNLDDESAHALGVNVKLMRLVFVVMATFLASCSVTLGGIIGWVGLVIPHIARFIIGANHRFMLPFCALFGALFLLFCDSLARGLLSTEIPLGILTSIFGIPIFVAILYTTKRAVNE